MNHTMAAGGVPGPRVEVGGAGEEADQLTVGQIGMWYWTAVAAGVPDGARVFGAADGVKVTRLFVYPPPRAGEVPGGGD
jgi:hypothetical protein